MKQLRGFFSGFRSNMSQNVIGGLVGLMLLFGLLVCVIGNRCIVSAFKNEYATATRHMADAAAVYVNGDHLDDYLAGEEMEEYNLIKNQLDVCCHRLNVTMIYVIMVDTSDYGRFVSIFNPINNRVDNSSYVEWELGYKRDTTNDEYREKYRAIYEKRTRFGTVFRLHPTDGQHPHITTMVPVKDSSGDVVAILCMQRPMSEISAALTPYFRMIIAGVLAMVILISLLAATFLKRSIIRPVEKVADEAMRFARENAKGEPLGDISNYNDILNLARSIDAMETEMMEYVEKETAAATEKERMRAELSIAAMIQNDALPDDFPAFPDRHEFDLYATMDPAKEVGGDFYNFFLLDDDHLVLVMADVSGKGIPGCLFMMVTNILITERAQMGGTPAEILEFVNENVCTHNRADMFVTVWLGILEISTGKLIAANAGHEYPAICPKGGDFEIYKDTHGFVVGGMEEVRFKNYELQLGKGDKLFLYTDGVPEATDMEDNMYTTDRMIVALNEHKTGSPKEILEGVRQSVNEFVGEAPPFDDMTMLCFEYKDV